MKAIRAFFAAGFAALELMATEIRTGIKLTEAVSVDEFETQLRMLTNTPEQRDDIRQGALLIAKLGVSADELAEAALAIARGTKEGTP